MKQTAGKEVVETTVALIGCGAVAQLFYAPALREMENCGLVRVIGLVDSATEALNSMSKTFPKAKADEGLHSIFQLKPDLVIVCSPPHLHRQHAEAALTAGCAVLCEKPMAASTVDCAAMLEASRVSSKLLAIGLYKRFFPAHLAIKRFIERATFGPLHSFTIEEGGKFTWPARSDSFFRREQTPGGVLLDIGVHVLDLLIWWLGKPISTTYYDDALDGLEANCLLNATWNSGVTGKVRLSRDWPTKNCHVFCFRDATLHCRVNASNKLEITFRDLPMTFAGEMREPLQSRPSTETAALSSNPQAFIDQLRDVIAAIHEGRSPLVGGEEGLEVMQWIEECYSSKLPLEHPWSAISAGTHANCVA